MWRFWKILIFLVSREFNGAVRYWAWRERNQSFARFWQFASWASQEEDLPAKINCWIIIVCIARIAAAGCCASHVVIWFFTQTLILGIEFIKSIPKTLVDTVDTFRRPPLTPHVLNAFTVIRDEMWKYFAICVCTGYYREGHSPLLLYYELLVATIGSNE